jgi:hypothetical protein
MPQQWAGGVGSGWAGTTASAAAGNDYSVDPAAIGAMVEVLTDLDTVTVTADGHTLATHQRVWAKNMTITDAAHVATAATLRAAFQHPRPTAGDKELLRDLSVYDRAFGVEIAEHRCDGRRGCRTGSPWRRHFLDHAMTPLECRHRHDPAQLSLSHILGVRGRNLDLRKDADRAS